MGATAGGAVVLVVAESAKTEWQQATRLRATKKWFGAYVASIDAADTKRKKWQQAMEPVWNKFEKEIGPDVIKSARDIGNNS